MLLVVAATRLLRGEVASDWLWLLVRDPVQDDITNLLEYVLTTAYFQWSNELFEQTDGVAMSSPLASVVANYFMEHFETLH